MKNYTWLNDPSHGWLSVPRKDVIALGVAGKISSYSYQKGNRVYLEEDMDAGIFLDAAKAAGWEISFKHSHTDKRHWVRSCAMFLIGQ